MRSLSVEPTEAADFATCECCGSATRRVWGFVHDPDGTVAAYFVQWAVGRVADHGALFDLVLVAQTESSGAGHDATRCCMKVSITSTSSATSPVNGVRSQRPL